MRDPSMFHDNVILIYLALGYILRCLFGGFKKKRMVMLSPMLARRFAFQSREKEKGLSKEGKKKKIRREGTRETSAASARSSRSSGLSCEEASWPSRRRFPFCGKRILRSLAARFRIWVSNRTNFLRRGCNIAMLILRGQ